MVRKTKADLKAELKTLKRKNFELKQSVNNGNTYILGLTAYVLISTIMIVLLLLP